MSTSRRIQMKQAHDTCIEFARYAGRTANPLRALSAAELGRCVSNEGVVTSEATYQHDYSGCS